jgi:hypothetical protein
MQIDEKRERRKERKKNVCHFAKKKVNKVRENKKAINNHSMVVE